MTEYIKPHPHKHLVTYLKHPQTQRFTPNKKQTHWKHTHTHNTYRWWTKSCTTKDDDYPIIYKVLTIPGMVVQDFVHQQSVTKNKWSCFFFQISTLQQDPPSNSHHQHQGYILTRQMEPGPWLFLFPILNMWSQKVWSLAIGRVSILYIYCLLK